MTSDEKVKGEGELRECSAGHSIDELLSVHFQESVASSSRQTNEMPLTDGHWLRTPVVTTNPPTNVHVCTYMYIRSHIQKYVYSSILHIQLYMHACCMHAT